MKYLFLGFIDTWQIRLQSTTWENTSCPFGFRNDAWSVINLWRTLYLQNPCITHRWHGEEHSVTKLTNIQFAIGVIITCGHTNKSNKNFYVLILTSVDYSQCTGRPLYSTWRVLSWLSFSIKLYCHGFNFHPSHSSCFDNLWCRLSFSDYNWSKKPTPESFWSVFSMSPIFSAGWTQRERSTLPCLPH